MVVISKHVGEKVVIAHEVMISLVEIEGQQVKIGIEPVGGGASHPRLRHLRGAGPIIAGVLASAKTVTDTVHFFWP
jgi:Global regulator protein family